MIENETFNLNYSGDSFISVSGTAAEIVFIFTVSQIEENEQGKTLYWTFAIFDLDDRMLHTDSGRVGTIGALPHDKAKAVAEYVASQEAILWINKHLPGASIVVLQKEDTNE